MHVHWLNLFSYFWSGVFLANAVPLFVSGIMGRRIRGRSPNRLEKGSLRRPSNCSGAFPVPSSVMCWSCECCEPRYEPDHAARPALVHSLAEDASS
jgi:hypothetical protein